MKRLITGLGLGLIATTATAATPTMEEMWEIIQRQQAEIADLKSRLAATAEEVTETAVMAEATASIVEEGVAASDGAISPDWTDTTQIGGYAEMHYNNLDDNHDNGGDKDEIDFHRFVFFLEHEFSADTRFFSEVELEHSIAGDGQEGEVELEQAYIEHDLMDRMAMKAGLFLVPVGILNQTHEPDTFYGVERNGVESNIIPSTWWEGGMALHGEFAPGWNYEAQMTSGLKLDAEAGQFKIRDGRQKVSEADASDFAYTGNLRYTGIAGLELGATIQYQEDLYQGDYRSDVDAMLYTAHVAYRNGPFGLRAVGAAWDIDDAINDIKVGADQQEGWYIEPSWLVMRDLGLFTRYSEWDNQAGGGDGTDIEQWNAGLNYWLVENVVFKVDYQWQDTADSQSELEGLNLGVGWSY